MAAMIKMVVVLSLFCAMSGFVLSYLKTSTAAQIESQVLTFVQEPAIKTVYPYAENNPVEERKAFDVEGKKVMVFPYKQGGKLVGVAIENSSAGYGGEVGIMVGFNVENNSLIGIGITTTKETPGIGSRITDSFFTDKFVGIDSATVAPSSDGGTIDTLAGATISSAATIAAVQKASKEYAALKDTIMAEFN